MTSSSRIQLADQYYIEININDEPVYLNPSNWKIEICNSILCKLPTMKINIDSEQTGRLLNYFELTEGTKIVVDIGNEREDNRNIISHWILFSEPKYSQGSSGLSISILCILDNIRYLGSRVPQSYNGTASSVISLMAANLDMETTNYLGNNTIDQSNDSMVWRPRSAVYRDQFAHITERAYNNEESCYIHAIDEENVCYFRNISLLSQQEPRNWFVQDSNREVEGKKYQILNYRVRSKSGLLNNWVGYSATSSEEPTSGIFSSRNTVAVARNSEFLSMSRQNREDIGANTGRYEYNGIDNGNRHEQFYNASYQNRRIASTYSFILEVIVETMIDDDLLSLVGVEIIDPVSREINNFFSGYYIIRGKTRLIVGNRYYEKLVLVSQGPNQHSREREI